MKTVHHLTASDIKLAIDSYLRQMHKKNNVVYKVSLTISEGVVEAVATEEANYPTSGYKD